MAKPDTCVSCGGYVPEGRMVCKACEDAGDYDTERMYENITKHLLEIAARIGKDVERLRARLSMICDSEEELQ
jgi:hypothetical protein